MKLDKIVKEFPEYRTDGKILFCKICDKSIAFDKIFNVKQQLLSTKHVQLVDRKKNNTVTQQFLSESAGEPSRS